MTTSPRVLQQIPASVQMARSTVLQSQAGKGQRLNAQNEVLPIRLTKFDIFPFLKSLDSDDPIIWRPKTEFYCLLATCFSQYFISSLTD